MHQLSSSCLLQKRHYSVIKGYKLLTFLTNFGVSISMNPERTASRKLFWLLNVMRPEPAMKTLKLRLFCGVCLMAQIYKLTYL